MQQRRAPGARRATSRGRRSADACRSAGTSAISQGPPQDQGPHDQGQQPDQSSPRTIRHRPTINRPVRRRSLAPNAQSASGVIARTRPKQWAMRVAFLRSPSSRRPSSPAPRARRRRPALHVPSGLHARTIADVPGARELAALPNGDLIVGTRGQRRLHRAQRRRHAGPAAGLRDVRRRQRRRRNIRARRSRDFRRRRCITSGRSRITANASRVAIRRIADVRSGPVAPGTDGDVHSTTSVAYRGRPGLRVGRVVVQRNDGSDGAQPVRRSRPDARGRLGDESRRLRFTQRAKRIRNAIALAVNPQTQARSGWATRDRTTSSSAIRTSFSTTSPRTRATPITAGRCARRTIASTGPGRLFQDGRAARRAPRRTPRSSAPRSIRSTNRRLRVSRRPIAAGFSSAAHGSWHRTARRLQRRSPPRVAFVPMRGDRPAKRVDWRTRRRNGRDFVTGFQNGCTSRRRAPHGRRRRRQGLALRRRRRRRRDLPRTARSRMS